MEGVVATWGAVGLLLRDQKGSATEGGEGGAWACPPSGNKLQNFANFKRGLVFLEGTNFRFLLVLKKIGTKSNSASCLLQNTSWPSCGLVCQIDRHNVRLRRD